MTASELLGPLNEVEKKFAPKELFVLGHTEILEEGPRVSIVGSRDASENGLRRAKKLARLVCESRKREHAPRVSKRRNDVGAFMCFVGIRRPEEFRTVARSHVIAWRKALEQRKLAPADDPSEALGVRRPLHLPLRGQRGTSQSGARC